MRVRGWHYIASSQGRAVSRVQVTERVRGLYPGFHEAQEGPREVHCFSYWVGRSNPRLVALCWMDTQFRWAYVVMPLESFQAGKRVLFRWERGGLRLDLASPAPRQRPPRVDPVAEIIERQDRAAFRDTALELRRSREAAEDLARVERLERYERRKQAKKADWERERQARQARKLERERLKREKERLRQERLIRASEQKAQYERQLRARIDRRAREAEIIEILRAEREKRKLEREREQARLERRKRLEGVSYIGFTTEDLIAILYDDWELPHYRAEQFHEILDLYNGEGSRRVSREDMDIDTERCRKQIRRRWIGRRRRESPRKFSFRSAK